jgi:hypothetical protein
MLLHRRCFPTAYSRCRSCHSGAAATPPLMPRGRRHYHLYCSCHHMVPQLPPSTAAATIWSRCCHHPPTPLQVSSTLPINPISLLPIIGAQQGYTISVRVCSFSFQTSFACEFRSSSYCTPTSPLHLPRHFHRSTMQPGPLLSIVGNRRRCSGPQIMLTPAFVRPRLAPRKTFAFPCRSPMKTTVSGTEPSPPFGLAPHDHKN